MSISAPPPEPGETRWALALGKLTDALRLLDESNAPLEIGAEVDLAIHRLQNAIRSAGVPPPTPWRSED